MLPPVAVGTCGGLGALTGTGGLDVPSIPLLFKKYNIKPATTAITKQV